jgi:hypothetical protein
MGCLAIRAEHVVHAAVVCKSNARAEAVPGIRIAVESGEGAMKITTLTVIRCSVLGFLAFTQIAGAAGGRPQREPHRPIPFSMLEEHAEIVMALRSAVDAGGALSAAARDVLEIVEPHMRHEQELALAPLRLLPRLADGEVTADMTPLIAVTDRLRAELPALRKEHVALRRALEGLWETAWRDGKPEYAFIAQRINRHITVDEEVHFPAALLVGDYLRLRLAASRGSDTDGAR